MFFKVLVHILPQNCRLLPTNQWHMEVKVKLLSCVQLFVTQWTVACQASPPFMEFSRQEYWSGFPFSFSRGKRKVWSQPRDHTQVSHIASRLFTLWATRSPKSTGAGSLSLLQQVFLTQELNQGLLHCRQILHQLSYQGNP